MLFVFPDYYKNFKCIAGECGHSCCIGWEIDIDPETLARYDALSGSFAHRIQAHISREEDPHFLLGEEERCPFLNQDNLCDIILTLGEDALCNICTNHPRFRNELPGRLETGLGLCCEEAARLILSQTEPCHLEISGTAECDDDILFLRDQVISLLQDRSRSIPQRVREMLCLCNASLPPKSMESCAAFLLELERLDDAWTNLLQLLLKEGNSADFLGFDLHMTHRQTEYEQFLVYLVYRHLANASDEADVAARAAFAAWGYHLLYHLGALLWTKQGRFSFEDQVELVRLFSSELEYSDDNRYAILDELQ